MAVVTDLTIRRAHAQREAVEKELTKVYARALRELGEWIIEQYSLPADETALTAAALTPDGLTEMLTRWNQIVRTSVKPRMRAAFFRHWSWVANNIAGSANGVETNIILGPNVRDVWADRNFAAVEPRIKDIGRTMHNELSTVLRNRFEEGATPGDTAQAIRDEIGDRMLGRNGVTPSRAKVIARTETGAVVSGADQAISEELFGAGVVTRKKWLSTHDARTRPAHQLLDGQTIGVHESFKVDGATLRYPCDPNGRADLVIQCRCTTLLEVVDNG